MGKKDHQAPQQQKENEFGGDEIDIQKLLNARGKNVVNMVNDSKHQTPMTKSKWVALLLSFALFVGLFVFLANRPHRDIQEKRKGSYTSVLSSSRGEKGVKRNYVFPPHWGKPDEQLLWGGKNEVKLPGGYGLGSVGLAEWVQRKIEEDSRILQEIHKRSENVV